MIIMIDNTVDVLVSPLEYVFRGLILVDALNDFKKKTFIFLFFFVLNVFVLFE